jgi:hypothetical protein
MLFRNYIIAASVGLCHPIGGFFDRISASSLPIWPGEMLLLFNVQNLDRKVKS